MAENQEPSKVVETAVKEAKKEEKKEDIEAKHEKVSRSLENIYADRLKAKVTEMEAIEKAIDKKIAEHKDFIAKTEISGRGMAAITKSQEQIDKEKSEEKIKRIMSSVGR